MANQSQPGNIGQNHQHRGSGIENISPGQRNVGSERVGTQGVESADWQDDESDIERGVVDQQAMLGPDDVDADIEDDVEFQMDMDEEDDEDVGTDTDIDTDTEGTDEESTGDLER